MQKPNTHRYPCRVCGKKWRLTEMSQQLMCFACIGRAIVAGGKFGGEKRWKMEESDLGGQENVEKLH